MRWCIFGTDFFVCDCEKLKMYWMYIEFFGKKQAGKDVSKMCRRINQWFLKSMRIIRSLPCKNPFCPIVKGFRFSEAREEQIPTAMSEERTKRVNYHKNGNLPLFCIEKDTRNRALYAPFACVLMAYPKGFEPSTFRVGV